MKRMVASAGLAAALFVGVAGVASADQDNGTDAFLCPVIGEGALGAPGLAGEVGPYPGGGATITPGNEQAGVHANANALNEMGGPGPENRPGADGFTPIWNP